MIVPVYIRVAKTDGRKGYKVAASTTPNNEPLYTVNGGNQYHPTVAFAVKLDLPDELFDQASRVIAELKISMKDALIAGEISLPTGITVKNKR